VTDEDRQRSAFFQGNLGREDLEKSAANYDEYLQQLQMIAHVGPISEENIVRATQLINKTNQFNLTTRRLSEAEVRTLIEDPLSYTATTRLVDKFGDNGLISVVAGHIDASDAGVLHVDLWLMSCRVLKRGVETFDMERLLAFCRDRGVTRIMGRYIPTPKNKLVESHYDALGFSRVETDAEGTTWRYDVGTPLATSHFISVEH
jgi:FkbH-like protein